MLKLNAWAIKELGADGKEYFLCGSTYCIQYLLFLDKNSAEEYIADKESKGLDYSGCVVRQVIMTLEDGALKPDELSTHSLVHWKLADDVEEGIERSAQLMKERINKHKPLPPSTVDPAYAPKYNKTLKPITTSEVKNV